jgi:hypothetical protein
MLIKSVSQQDGCLRPQFLFTEALSIATSEAVSMHYHITSSARNSCKLCAGSTRRHANSMANNSGVLGRVCEASRRIDITEQVFH